MNHANPSNHTHPRKSNHTTRLLLGVVAVATMLLSFATTAKADEIQTNNLWVPNVTIQNITDGQVVYLTNLGSEVDIPLTQVQGIKVPAYPDLWAAQEAILAKKDIDALPLLLKVQGQARQQWLKNYAAWLNIHVMDRLERTPQAVEAYLALAREKPDSFYLQRPPLSSLANVSDTQKADLAKRLQEALPDFDGVAKAAIEAMIQRLAVAAAPGTPAVPGDAGATTPAQTPGATPVTPGIVDANAKVTNKSGVVLSTYLIAPERDSVTPLLFEGKWQEAVDRCKELLKGHETRMSMRLYQLGIAQLQLAEKSGSEDAYKDAGLSLARSIIYFPSSSIVGPSLVELGFIHQKIGRTDLALKLWDKARLQVDETQDPEVYARLQQLITAASSNDTTN